MATQQIDFFGVPGLSSDHAVREIIIEIVDSRQKQTQLSGATWNMLAQMHNAKNCIGGDYTNNPGDVSEDYAGYKSRKIYQLSEIQTLKDQRDFIVLQEADWIRKPELKEIYEKTIRRWGWDLVYPTSDHSCDLVILYNRCSLKFTGDCENIFQHQQRKYRGFAANFTCTFSGKIIKIGSIHLPHAFHYGEIVAYQVKQIEEGIVTILGGDLNECQTAFPTFMMGIGASNFTRATESTNCQFTTKHSCIASRETRDKIFDGWLLTSNLECYGKARVGGESFIIDRDIIKKVKSSLTCRFMFDRFSIVKNPNVKLFDILLDLDHKLGTLRENPEASQQVYDQIITIYDYYVRYMSHTKQQIMNFSQLINAVKFANLLESQKAYQQQILESSSFDSDFSSDSMQSVEQDILSENSRVFIQQTFPSIQNIFGYACDNSVELMFENYDDIDRFVKLLSANHIAIGNCKRLKPTEYKQIGDQCGHTVILTEEECKLFNIMADTYYQSQQASQNANQQPCYYDGNPYYPNRSQFFVSDSGIPRQQNTQVSYQVRAEGRQTTSEHIARYLETL